MRICPALLLFFVLTSFASPMARAAEDLQFLDGKIWSAVRIIERGEGYLLVMHERGVRTVWGATLTEECTTRLALARLAAPDPAKISADTAARMETQRAQQEMERERSEAYAEKQRRDRAMREARAKARALSIQARHYLQGVIIQRLDDGALVHAQDVGLVQIGPTPPPDLWKPAGEQQRPGPTLPCVKGLIYVHESPLLLFKDSDAKGIVYFVGEYSYTDVQGAPQRVAAWSFSPP